MITEMQIWYVENGTAISTRSMSVNITYNATDSRTQIFDVLHPNYNYTVTMAAITNIGRSPYSEPVTVTMPMAGIYVANILYNSSEVQIHDYLGLAIHITCC